MCGRYASFRDAQDLADYFALREMDEDAESWAPNWNVAPTQQVRIIQQDEGGARRLRLARWGLVPSWAKDPSVGTRMINARSETAATKPAFRAALAKRRCGVVADAYYEWKKDGAAKTPYAIGLADGGPFAFAGMYEFWRENDEAPWLASVTILTTAARGQMASLHDREPVILSPGALGEWLQPASSGPDALAAGLAGMVPVAGLAWHPVGKAVGSVASNGPQLLEPAS